MSRSVIEHMTRHFEREARVGGYVAQAESAELIERGRTRAAALLGFRADEVYFTESATAALSALLLRLKIPVGSTVLVAPSEFGPNLDVFAVFGLQVVALPVADVAGHIDAVAAAQLVQQIRPSLVHLCLHPSHRGIIQSPDALADQCRAAGIPLIVDAAQGFAHLELTSSADAVYATSRKWLCGPRGVGILACRSNVFVQEGQRLEASEANIAGRIGFATALDEHFDLGPSAVQEGLAAIGARTRERLNGVGGWTVAEASETPSAITTLAPPPGWSDNDVLGFREALLDGTAARDRVVTTYAGPERAPLEAPRAVLRISPHLDVTDQHLDIFADALAHS